MKKHKAVSNVEAINIAFIVRKIARYATKERYAKIASTPNDMNVPRQ